MEEKLVELNDANRELLLKVIKKVLEYLLQAEYLDAEELKSTAEALQILVWLQEQM